MRPYIKERVVVAALVAGWSVSGEAKPFDQWSGEDKASLDVLAGICEPLMKQRDYYAKAITESERLRFVGRCEDFLKRVKKGEVDPPVWSQSMLLGGGMPDADFLKLACGDNAFPTITDFLDCAIPKPPPPPPPTFREKYVEPTFWSPYTWLAVLGLVGTVLWRPVLFPAFVRWRRKRSEGQPVVPGTGSVNITVRQARPLSEWLKAAYWTGRLALLAIPTIWVLGHMSGVLDLLSVFVPDDLRPAVARFLEGVAGKIERPPE